MKKTLSLLFAFALLLTCCLGHAFAEVHINNQMKDGEGNQVIVGSPGKQENGLQMILSTSRTMLGTSLIAERPNLRLLAGRLVISILPIPLRQ